MDALELLKQDHQKVKELLEEAEATEDGKEQKEIFKQIKKELETHARIEETVFYPAMEKHEELKDIVLESYEEHKQIKTLLREMEDLVEHHAEEEEEGKLFPKIRDLLDDAALEQLGQELESAKHKER